MKTQEVKSFNRKEDIKELDTNTNENYSIIYIRTNIEEIFINEDYVYTKYKEIQLTPSEYIQLLEEKNKTLVEKLSLVENSIIKLMMEE